MSSAKITVRERIAPEITASLFANYRSSADAVMELIDNAVDSRIPKQPLTVEITVHPRSLVIATVGGQGMGVRDLERNYLRWGGSPKRGRQLLGQYGQGGKAAIGHLGRRFSVEASRPADAAAWRFADDDYRDRSRLKTYELTEVPKRVEADLGYVRIRIDDIDKRIDVRRLGQRLAETYRPLLDSGQLLLTLDRVAIQPSPLLVAERRAFAVNAGGARLRGWIGVGDPAQMSSGWVPGIRCYRLGRLIVEGEFFGHVGPATVPALVRLMGEVDVPDVRLTMNKSDFERDGERWLEVEQRMHRLLTPWVRRLERDQEIPPPKSAVKVAEQVRKLLSQALRLSDRQDLFAGFAPTAPEATKGDQEELPLDTARRTDTGPREPRTPPPAPADAPPAARHRGFGVIAIRALDEKVRSMTVVEDGVRTVVINSRYPLFVQRRGDVWYQLETAAREIFKVDNTSVSEYEKRVNDILLMALKLRARRKHRTSARQLRLVED